MLTRKTAFDALAEATFLKNSNKTAIGRSLRRFLQRWTEDGCVSQVLAQGEGHTREQLLALMHYGAQLAQRAAPYVPAAGAFQAVVFDPAQQRVVVRYRLAHDVRTACVRELRAMAELVSELASEMCSFALNVNTGPLRNCPEYEYRNFPCSIVPDEALWCVSGQDAMGADGVLEWCTDESDAQCVLEKMQRFPDRFTQLAAQKWSEVPVRSSTTV